MTPTLVWLAEHEGASLRTAAEALGLKLGNVERLFVTVLVEPGMLERR